MEIRYNRVVDKKFMIVSQLEEEVSLFEIEMLEQNTLRQQLAMSLVISDGRPEFWYDITNLLPLESWLKFKKIGSDLFEKMLDEVVLSHLEVGEYLLKTESLSLDPSLIFVNMETNQHYFCYLPGQKTQPNSSKSTICGFLESLLSIIDFQNKDFVSEIYHMLELLQQTDGSYQSLQNCLQREREKREKHVHSIIIEESEPILQKEKSGKEFLDQQKSKVIEGIMSKWKEWTDWSLELKMPLFKTGTRTILKHKKKNRVNKPNTVILKEETCERPVPIIDFDQEFGVVGELVYLGEDGYPAIEVGSEKITIGNNEQIADVVIEDVTISKIHALIEYIGGDYFLEDLNSVYGTFINGERLGYLERRKLFSEDVVHFAKAKYRFH